MTDRRLVPVRDLEPRYGIRISERHLRRMWQSGEFPAPVKLGSSHNARVNFVADEVEAWLTAKITARSAA